MATLIEYKCPCCGGKIEFDSASQQMKCPYCETTFDVEAMLAQDAALKDQPQDKMDWDTPTATWDEEQAGMRVYACQSCGGQIVTDDTTAATHCPYCGNPVVMAGNLSGVLKPDYVIPFQLDKKAAKEILKKHFTGKKLLPKTFQSEAHLEEIKGVYVPFWLYGAEADVNARMKATRVKRWSDSHYHYTQTSYFAVERAGSIAFDHVPVDGASKIPDDLMESLEPFDFSKAVPFQSAYLAGFLADKYDMDSDKSMARANERIRASAVSAFQDTVTGYHSVTNEHCAVQFRNSKVSYAMFPVWLLTTRYQDQNYLFAINGQTGKIAGNLPMDNGAYWKWKLIYSGLIGAAAFAVIALLNLF